MTQTQSDKENRMKVIYIAGKYRSNQGEWWIRENIRAAEKAAQMVWQWGGAALCPHKNTAFFGGLPGCPDQIWLDGDLEMLWRCDAVWAIEGYEESSGALKEIEYARTHGIPVLYDAQVVKNFIEYNEETEDPIEYRKRSRITDIEQKGGLNYGKRN
jgi:hypothetical protein